MSAESEEKSPTAVQPKAAKRERSERRHKPMPLWHVILLDDNDHTHEYVVEMLKCVFAHPEPLGYRMAQEVDTTGRVIVFTSHRELAELKREQIHAYGLDIRVATCKGSMTATLEPAEPQ